MGFRITTNMMMNSYRYNLQGATKKLSDSWDMVLTQRKQLRRGPRGGHPGVPPAPELLRHLQPAEQHQECLQQVQHRLEQPPGRQDRHD